MIRILKYAILVIFVVILSFSFLTSINAIRHDFKMPYRKLILSGFMGLIYHSL